MGRLVLLGVWLGFGIVHADPDPEARRLLDEGTRLFTEDASFHAARDAFEKSYQLEPSWRALNGIALVEQEQGKLVEALATYEKLAAEFESVLSDAQRSTVAARIAALASKISTIEISTAQAAAVTLDTEDLGVGPLHVTRRVLPGRHIVLATLAGHQTLSRAIVLAPGGRETLALALAPERVVVKVEEVPLRRRFARTTPYVVGGSGLVAIAIGGVMHAVASRDFDRFDDSVAAASGSPPMAVPGDRSLHDRALLERRIAYGSYAVGGLAVIAGAVLFAINQPRPEKRRGAASIAVVPATRGLGLGVRF